MNGRHRRAVALPIVGGAGLDGRSPAASLRHHLVNWRHAWLALALIVAGASLARDAAAQIVAGPNANIGG